MNFKRYVEASDTWVDSHYIRGTSTDTITPPTTIYGDGTNATLTLKGNTVQSGTPTPSNPVDVDGCGERTANLFDLSAYYAVDGGITNISIDNDTITYNVSSTYRAIRYKFNLSVSDVFTIGLGSESDKVQLELRYLKNDAVVGTMIIIRKGNYQIIRGDNAYDAFTIYISNGDNTGTCKASNIMLNTGSTALPYEPYGYKIPISSANTTTPVYLGEVETTRKIKKLVLDGTESWNEGTFNYYIFINVSDRGEGIPNSAALSTHTESGVVVNNNGTALFFNKSVFVHSSLADFKSYLAQQYANGTPVTVWYVLATSTTGTVNEPLMKIGSYSDSLTTSIPTTDGANALSIGTTVQPSEVTANYHGWHPVQSVHERESGQWD